MSRKLIVVGNGLGMAIAPKQFALKPVMQRIWREGLQENERKLLAKHFRDIDEDNGPSEERHLMVAQVAVMMPELIGHEKISHATNLGEWFSNPPQLDTLKSALNKYTYLIAKDLFITSYSHGSMGNPIETWESSKAEDALEQFYKNEDSKSPHIATLNYDGFLYDSSLFADHTDGFSKYTDETVVSWKNDFGKDTAPRYLHLHGSPLFWGSKAPEKLSARHLDLANIDDGHHIKFKNNPDFTPHIILSDGALKPLLISRSQVLSAYWKELENILLNDKPEEIILFGYGGGDDHLNRLIGESKCPVRVVEWCDDHSIPDREQEWKKWLGDDTNVIVDLRKDILTFDEWDN